MVSFRVPFVEAPPGIEIGHRHGLLGLRPARARPGTISQPLKNTDTAVFFMRGFDSAD